MRKTFIALLLFFAVVVAKAQTIEVNGDQTGVWEADTVLVTGDVTVIDSLTIRPGTTVLFDRFYGITVSHGASFSAAGEDTAKIVFTVADTLGFHVYNQGRGGWNGIRLEKAGKVVLDHCLLQYGKAADTLDRFGGALNIFYCDDVTISNSELRCNFARECGGAVYAEHSNVRFSECIIRENKVYTEDGTYAMYGGGACFKNCEVEMNWMTFHCNYGPTCIGGAMSLDSCALILDHAAFVSNTALNGGGMYLMRSNHRKCRISNALFDNNFSGHFGGGLAISDASPEVYNITVTRNSSQGVNCNGIFFYQECSPKLTNCIIYGNYPQSDVLGPADTIQMWLWTFSGYNPEFRNCLIENGLRSITITDSIQVFENIIEGDPCFRFAEGFDFRLSENSPCIDAGSPVVPDFLAEGLDLAAMPRVANQRIDLGPYEYSPHQVPETPVSAPGAQLFGNPLDDQSRVEFDLGRSGAVMLRVYTLTGCQVASQSLGRMQAGHHAVLLSSLTASLKPGFYLVEIRTPERNYVLKAIR